MKKALSLIIVFIVIFTFASCTQKTAEITIDINAVKNTIIEDLELKEPLEIDKENFCERYAVDAADISEVVCFVTLNGTFPDEAIIIKAVNEDAKLRITEKLNSHLDEVKVQSQNYDAENYALAQECKIIEKGNYLALFISAKHAQMEKIFEESFNQ